MLSMQILTRKALLFYLPSVHLRDEINPLPNDRSLVWSKLKASARDKINVTQKLKFVSRKMVNNVLKRPLALGLV